MANSMRDQLKDNNTKKILALGLIFAFLAPIVFSLFNKSGGSGQMPIAYVDNYEISVPEFKRKYSENHQVVEQIKQQFGPYAQNLLQFYGLGGNLNEATLNQLVQDKLFMSVIDKLGISIGSQYIEDKLSDPLFVKASLGEIIPPAVLSPQGIINIDMLNRYLKERDISPEQFDTMVKNALEKELILQLVNQSVYVPQEMAKELYIKQEIPRTYDSIELDLENYKNKINKEEVSQEELTAYYQQNSSVYTVPEKRSAVLWEFNAQSFDISINDKDVQTYYEKNKESYKDNKNNTNDKDNKDKVSYKSLDAVKDQIKMILTQERFLKRFNAQAGRIITQSKENPKALQAFITDKKGLKEELVDLAQDGSVLTQKLFNLRSLNSKAFYTQNDNGYIIELTNIKPSFIALLEDVKEKVEEDYKDQKARLALQEDLQESYKSLLSHDKDLAQIAKDLNISLKTIILDPKNTQELEDYNKKSIPTSALLDMAYKGSITYGTQDNNSYIAVLKELNTPVNQDELDLNKNKLIAQAKSSIDNTIYQTFVDNLRKNATIKYNR